LRIVPHIPASIGAVIESGIFTGEDARQAGAAGADAILVGEALVTAEDIAAKMKELAEACTPSPFSLRGSG
jgi:indole-3-glycerol phosphate synthase